MRKISRLGFLGAFCLLLFLGSCSLAEDDYIYVFENQTQYTIDITVHSDYWIRPSSGEERVKKGKSDTISLWANTTQSIDVTGGDSLNFQWTSGSNNSKISSNVSGNRAVFKER